MKNQRLKSNPISSTALPIATPGNSEVARLRHELQQEQEKSAALERQVYIQRSALATVDMKMERLSGLLQRVITGYKEMSSFENPVLEVLNDGGKARCWLHDPNCANAPGLDSFSDRMTICAACDAFKQVAPDAYTRSGELINSIIFLLNRHHDQFKSAQAQLIQSERLAGLGEMAAGLAHEINTPVGIILARLDCMQMEQMDSGNATLHDDLEVVRRHAIRLRKITSSLTSFARRHKIEKRPVILQDLLHEILEISLRMVEKGNVELQPNLPDSPMTVHGDGTLIQQVFMNLIINARDAMPDGGQLHIHGQSDADYHILEFRDTGVGMDEETCKRAFDPFFSTKAERGTGLGLSVSYGIINELNGQITVCSQPGLGSIFRVAIPQYNPSQHGTAP